MLLAALGLNVLVLLPVISGLRRGALDVAFGADTVARRILTCVYASIALFSTLLIAMHILKNPWAVPMTMALFATQIGYKLLTAFAIGLRNPVVTTNMIVVTMQILAILTWSIAGR